MAEPGEFEVLAGSSSRDLRLTARFRLLDDPALALHKTGRLHIGLPLKVLLDDEAGKAVLEAHIPEVLAESAIAMGMHLSLEQIARFVPQILTPEKLREIDEALGKMTNDQ